MFALFNMDITQKLATNTQKTKAYSQLTSPLKSEANRGAIRIGAENSQTMMKTAQGRGHSLSR
jgi:hypothetical protein